MSDLSDRKSVRWREKQAKLAELVRREVICGIMSVPNGRQWVYDLLAGCHIWAQSFSRDPLITAFNEGERNVGIKLLNDIMQFCPEDYIQALREANGRQSADDARSNRDSAGRQGRDPGSHGEAGNGSGEDYRPDYEDGGSDDEDGRQVQI